MSGENGVQKRDKDFFIDCSIRVTCKVLERLRNEQERDQERRTKAVKIKDGCTKAGKKKKIGSRTEGEYQEKTRKNKQRTNSRERMR